MKRLLQGFGLCSGRASSACKRGLLELPCDLFLRHMRMHLVQTHCMQSASASASMAVMLAGRSKRLLPYLLGDAQELHAFLWAIRADWVCAMLPVGKAAEARLCSPSRWAGAGCFIV